MASVATYEARFFTLATLTNAIHYVSFYVYGALTGVLQVSLNSGGNWNTASVIGGAAGGWVRYGAQVPAAQASGSTRLLIRDSANENYLLDCLQVEANSYGTTYMDGDQGDGTYRWEGLRHGSASTRDAQERSGGRELNLEDDYGVRVVEGTKQIGMPPLVHNLQGQALFPGAVYQGFKILPREIELHLQHEGDSWSDFHSERQTLIDLFKPDRVRGAQAVVIGYAGSDSATKLYTSFYYNGGLELGDFLAYDEIAPLKLLAPDPFWYEDNRETWSLDFNDAITGVAQALRRHNGQWKNLGVGLNGTVQDIGVDRVRGRVYFVGGFTTANGVTVNGVCYWDGTTFVSMDRGVGGGGQAICVTVAPNGDVWVGGTFTTVGSAATATDGLARWNIATSTWTAFDLSAGAAFNDLEFDFSNNLYATGAFTNWNGNADSDRIVKYDGATWSNLGTGLSGTGEALKVFSDSVIYVAGQFTTGNGVTLNRIGYWNGTTFVALHASGADSTINALELDPAGNLYVGGSFTTIGGASISDIALWNGAAFSALGSGISNSVLVMRYLNGILYVGGAALTEEIALWNGYTWTPGDVGLPSGPNVTALMDWQGDLYIGFNTSGSASVSGLTTVTPSATTRVYPEMTLIGPSSASCVLQWLENQSAAERQFYNLTVQAGETVKINQDPRDFGVVSDWRGPITSQPLVNSDDFSLLPGANILAAYATGTLTGAALLMHAVPRHWSSDGAA